MKQEDDAPELDTEGMETRSEEAIRASAAAEIQELLGGATGGDPYGEGGPQMPGAGPVWEEDAVARTCGTAWGGGWWIYARYGEELEVEFVDFKEKCQADQVGEDIAKDLTPILEELFPGGGGIAHNVANLISTVAANAAATYAGIQSQKAAQPTEVEVERKPSGSWGIREDGDDDAAS